MSIVEFYFDHNENTVIVNKCQTKIFFYLLKILNVNRYANVILERCLRANEGHIGVNESISTIMKQIWTQMNGYFLEVKVSIFFRGSGLCFSFFAVKRSV